MIPDEFNGLSDHFKLLLLANGGDISPMLLNGLNAIYRIEIEGLTVEVVCEIKPFFPIVEIRAVSGCED